MSEPINNVTSCQTFFSLTDKDIPDDYREPFKGLAKKGGDPNKVDSCDLDSFYTEVGVTSAQERITNPDKFVEEKWRPTFGSWFRFINIFNYEKFYGNLAQTFRRHHFPKIKDVREFTEHNPQDKSQRRLSQTYQSAPSGLKEVIDEFQPRYELVRTNCVSTPPFGDETCEIDARYRYYYADGSTFLTDVTSGYGIIPLDSENGWITYDYPFSKENPFNWVKVQAYDARGNKLWYLKIDRSVLRDALPAVAIGGLGVLNKAFDQKKSPIEVQTDMTLRQWQAFSTHDFSLFRLMNLNIEEPTVTSLVKQRISTQINEDAQMWGWTRWIKHAWNRP